ncbi:DNA/RNA nuclease SfsA [Phyllobacterium sp. 21LDTY02-6]|jgi:sugar fermentation stimulation protein A|uniref:DNA/RNA nuclease SfsA n=1 Tax=Phyllobacterium sp. 21LDTY02-6 TaxID=2944903 RepID=UPI002020AE93|nr:DNA/RNA nuclease SfsA [Phyllobacterium sp. 21LDTY02-6]MCO4316741.1 DNA/RNA nuclease SfsA [Phyllobacterium sp. 21LDTY02-6]
MNFMDPLVTGRLVQRYKRFLADIVLDDGRAITSSVPNTGSMLGLTDPGIRVWLSHSGDAKRKYPHTLQIVEVGGEMVGVNTGLPNRIAEEAILSGLIPELSGYGGLRREQRYGAGSRIDLLLSDPVRGDAYVEVKNVHFSRTPGLAEFPDSPTARGAKHLDELGNMVENGHRGVMFYVVQRGDCDCLGICGDLDPLYRAAFDRAMSRGVEAYAVKCHITPAGIAAIAAIPIII